MVHLTAHSHFLVSSFHCTAVVCVCAVTQTLQSHTWRDLTPLAFRNFLIPAQLPAKNDLQPTKETYSQRSSHPPSQLAGYWEVPG